MTNAEMIFATIFTYWVEIDRPEPMGWTHIHCVDWETCNAYGDAMAYAIQVRNDHPGSRVRIVEAADDLPCHYISVA